jgi:hypothetical protein
VNPAFTSVGTQFFKPATGSTPEIPAIIGAENDFEVLSLLALLVQKYLLCWFKSANTDT